MKVWNIGNTTIRNPYRIKDGLVLLKEYEGKKWDETIQLNFYMKAKEIGIMESGTVKSGGEQLHARKWVSVMNQLGLARAWKSEDAVKISEVGNSLINDEIAFEEVMLRQLLKYQLPSAIENGADFLGFHVHPFKVFLTILYALYEQGISGLTKEEIGLYVITTLDDQDISTSIKKIIEYRKGREGTKGNAHKMDYFRAAKNTLIKTIYRSELTEAKNVIASLAKELKSFPKFALHLRGILFGKEPRKQKMTKTIFQMAQKGKSLGDIFEYYFSEFVETKGGTLQDYADSQIRYVVTTGLFSFNRDRIVLKDNKIDLVKAIVIQQPLFKDDGDYLEYLYNPSEPNLPLDDVDFMFVNVGQLQQRVDELSKQTGISPNIKPISDFSVPKLKKVNIDLEKELIRQKEHLFYLAQSQDAQIDDILDYFNMIEERSLLGGDAYFPAYYEWTIWRVFLAINTIACPIAKTRNFEIDEELKPIHHAKGGVPDMVFQYENFDLVCEATLHQSVSQWSAEYISVPKHVGHLAAISKKPVYGLFIAPRIEPNMAQQLYKADWHVGDDYIDLNIIPFSTGQIMDLLTYFKKTHFSINDLGALFGKMIALKHDAANGKEWHNLISNELSKIYR